MLRLALVDGIATVDRAGTLPGRGTYVCSPTCLARVDRRALSRAMRSAVVVPSDPPLRWPSEAAAL